MAATEASRGRRRAGAGESADEAASASWPKPAGCAGDRAAAPAAGPTPPKLTPALAERRAARRDRSAPEAEPRPLPNPRPLDRRSSEPPPNRPAERRRTAAAEPRAGLIEVWRQGRRHHEGAQARHGRAARAVASRARGDRDRRKATEPRRRHRRGDRRRPPMAASQGRHAGRAPARTSAVRSAAPSAARPPRRTGAPGARTVRRAARRRARAVRRPSRPASGGASDADDRRDGGQERREKQPDPNSPFAKLLALKAQLEDNARNETAGAMREDRQRLDKWLWFARFAKSRTLAAKLVADGFVRRQRPARRQSGQGARRSATSSPSRSHRTTLVVRVEDLGERRGRLRGELLYTDMDNRPHRRLRSD